MVTYEELKKLAQGIMALEVEADFMDIPAVKDSLARVFDEVVWEARKMRRAEEEVRVSVEEAREE